MTPLSRGRERASAPSRAVEKTKPADKFEHMCFSISARNSTIAGRKVGEQMKPLQAQRQISVQSSARAWIERHVDASKHQPRRTGGVVETNHRKSSPLPAEIPSPHHDCRTFLAPLALCRSSPGASKRSPDAHIYVNTHDPTLSGERSVHINM